MCSLSFYSVLSTSGVTAGAVKVVKPTQRKCWTTIKPSFVDLGYEQGGSI